MIFYGHLSIPPFVAPFLGRYFYHLSGMHLDPWDHRRVPASESVWVLGGKCPPPPPSSLPSF